MAIQQRLKLTTSIWGFSFVCHSFKKGNSSGYDDKRFQQVKKKVKTTIVQAFQHHIA